MMGVVGVCDAAELLVLVPAAHLDIFLILTRYTSPPPLPSLLDSKEISRRKTKEQER